MDELHEREMFEGPPSPCRSGDDAQSEDEGDCASPAGLDDELGAILESPHEGEDQSPASTHIPTPELLSTTLLLRGVQQQRGRPFGAGGVASSSWAPGGIAQARASKPVTMRLGRGEAGIRARASRSAARCYSPIE